MKKKLKQDQAIAEDSRALFGQVYSKIYKAVKVVAVMSRNAGLKIRVN